MSDRVKGFHVALDRDYKDEDASAISDAIMMVRGVLSVTSKLSGPSDWINRERISRELKQKLWNALESKP